MTRLVDDAYLTQDDLALAICQRLTTLIGAPRTVLEPSAGEGSFVRAALKVWPQAQVQSVEPRLPAAEKIGAGRVAISTFEDFAVRPVRVDQGVPGTGAGDQGSRAARYNLVLGNPPYKCAEEHVALARPLGQYVAFLLRMSFLSSQGRVERLWDPRPGLRWLIPLAQRPSFTGKGTDNSEYAVFVWEAGYLWNAEVTKHLWVK